jgi:hypothetical protein
MYARPPLVTISAGRNRQCRAATHAFARPRRASPAGPFRNISLAFSESIVGRIVESAVPMALPGRRPDRREARSWIALLGPVGGDQLGGV